MDYTTVFSFIFALLIRWIVSFHPYSGCGTPPMFGDYEAQRHWMEITINLPAEQWYTNSTENDLLYWGLDYPPLTAYHSFIMGKIAHFVNPEWVKLNHSRGFESYHHKLFMRSTVFISDILILLSALYYYWIKMAQSDLGSNLFFQSVIIPSLILIDYGHFQYNCITIGLFLWAVIFLNRESDLLATIFFCLALNYKQVALYYALPIFFYLLKRCFNQKSLFSIGFKFLTISLTVLITFFMLWVPYLRDLNSMLQVFWRIFPLNRGIYEDKVANFWFCISVFIKVKNFFTDSQLAFMSGILTLLTSLPSCYILFFHNTLKQLKYSLFIVSMAFFLFSFQVHEKTILFVNIAMMLLSDLNPFMTFWFSVISTFRGTDRDRKDCLYFGSSTKYGLQPLLIKDQLSIPYFALTIIYMTICQNTLKYNNKLINQLFFASMFGATMLSIGALVIRPPDCYPHIHSLLNCLYSFSHFVGFYVFFILKQLFIYKRNNYPNYNKYNIQMMTYIRPRPKTKIN